MTSKQNLSNLLQSRNDNNCKNEATFLFAVLLISVFYVMFMRMSGRDVDIQYKVFDIRQLH